MKLTTGHAIAQGPAVVAVTLARINFIFVFQKPVPNSAKAMQFEQLGPYRLGKKLGQGGMGAVYEGLDTESGEEAAVKVLAPALASEEGFRARFEAEIESLKKLRHPNIVRLFGYGEQSGTLFYAMELVRGTSLEDELRAGRRFEWREVTQIAIKLCRALKHAHDHGVIHRDLKPANLLMSTDGEIKLSDFGIARLFGNMRMTSDGGVLGTAEYMAPEQADGRVVTDRCDQYSMGGVLYTLLTGRPPFRAKTMVEMLQLQRYAEPELVTRFAPQTPAELARIVHQLLEKDPQKRFANALILSRSLEAMDRGLSISMSRGGDFVVAAAGTDISDSSPLSPTLTPTQLPPAERGEGTVVPQINATEATQAYDPAVENRPQSAPEPAATPATRFTKVEERHDERASAARELLAGLLAPQTLALLAGLLVMILGGWYLMRPPTADELYRQIETATADGEVESLRQAQPQIETFLERYADDPRCEKLRGMQDELKQTDPVQRAFTEAKRYALISPELGLVKFQALVDVYGEADVGSETPRQFVRLARQQIKRLERQIEKSVADDRKLVESRLERAAELSASDPAAARKIYQGIVQLYDQKPWAVQLVACARAALAAAPAPGPAVEATPAK
ncbi:MAG: serine/threonine protein kinase [Planctomycetia bacterium]|nr:serine/threonine protein kinase [Planctomycetia bacterium]